MWAASKPNGSLEAYLHLPPKLPAPLSIVCSPIPLIPLLHKAPSVLSYTSVSGLGEQQHKLEVLKQQIQAGTAGQSRDTSWGAAPGWHCSAGSSPPISYTESGGFRLLISVTLPPLRSGWIQAGQKGGAGPRHRTGWASVSQWSWLTFQACPGPHGFPLKLAQFWAEHSAGSLTTLANCTTETHWITSFFRLNRKSPSQHLNCARMHGFVSYVCMDPSSECWSVELPAELRGTALGTELLVFLPVLQPLSLVHQSTVLSLITGYKNYLT